MNLYLRMLWLLIRSLFKPRMPIDDLSNNMTLRVLPNDIDLNLHMNNGRYLTICDLSRVDMFIRSGLARTMLQQGWIPVIAEHTMTYKRSLDLFQKYEVKMEVTGWDDKVFYMSHVFIKDGRVVAEGLSKGCVRSKQGVVPPEQVIETVLERLEKKAA